jgi:hypothetical protein
MKIYTRTVWDMNTGEILEEDFHEYHGPVAEAKGGGGGSQGGTQTSTTEPWSPTHRHLRRTFNEAERLYNQGPPQYFQGQQVAGLNAQDTWAQNYLTNYAQGGAAGMADQLGGAMTFGLNAMDLSRNPYVADYAAAATRPLQQNLAENIMPQITNDAVSTGGVGSSRQGIAQGLAAGRTQQAIGDTTAKIYGDAYSKGLDTFGRTLALAPQTIQAGAMPAQFAGAAGEFQRQYEQSLIDAAMQQWAFEQQAPWANLAQYQGAVTGNYGGTTTATSTPNQARGSRWGSALGGALSGFAAGGPWGALAGGVLGAATG